MNVNQLRIRRAGVFAITLGVLALMVTGLLDRLLLGVLICVGLGLGLGNTQLTWITTGRITRAETPSKQKLAMSSAARLLCITGVSIIVAFLTRPDGIGIFFGLALFQVVIVLTTVVPELKALRQSS
ncbi:hypothetical protein [Nocardia sp. NPDC050406]|uniref:hypothetical protein n=1 Tax=Nocardia sp. NPDC050406 TaxID=3364318 RepID=UPI0037A058CE